MHTFTRIFVKLQTFTHIYSRGYRHTCTQTHTHIHLSHTDKHIFTTHIYTNIFIQKHTYNTHFNLHTDTRERAHTLSYVMVALLQVVAGADTTTVKPFVDVEERRYLIIIKTNRGEKQTNKESNTLTSTTKTIATAERNKNKKNIHKKRRKSDTGIIRLNASAMVVIVVVVSQLQN